MADIFDVFGFQDLPQGSSGAIRDLINFGIDIFTGSSPGLPRLPPAPAGAPPALPGIRQGPGPGIQGGAFPLAQVACATTDCCKGFHLNKSKGCDGSLPGTKCVRNRRMNPLNPKALRRAIRRATRFESFVKQNRKSLRSLSKI